MKSSHLFLAGILLVISTLRAAAQISIDEVRAEPQDVKFRDELKSTSVDVDYFSLARYKAERAAIRKERNYLEIGSGLQGTLTSYNDPWIAVSGGDNSIALVASFNLRHLFKKNLFSIETKLTAKLGYNRMKVEVTNDNGEKESNGVWFKNQDEFVFWVNPAFKLAKNWSYGSTFQFRSQFVNGYKSRTEQERENLKSTFLAPGYLDISLGLTYKSPESKFPKKWKTYRNLEKVFTVLLLLYLILRDDVVSICITLFYLCYAALFCIHVPYSFYNIVSWILYCVRCTIR